MLTEKEILTRLQNGENADAIAKELINTLNSANKAYVAEQEAKEKERAEAKRKAEAQKADANALIDMIEDYVYKYYPNENWFKFVFDDTRPEDFIAVVDESVKQIRKTYNSITSLNDLFKDAPKVKEKAEDKLADFLDRMGW